VAEGVSEEGLADAHVPDDGDVVVGFEEAQRGEFVEQGAVELDLGGLVPPLELGVPLQVAPLGPDGGRLAVAAGGLVAEREEQQVLVGHLLLAGEHEPLGKGIEHPGELEALQDGLQFGGDDVWVHGSSPSSVRSRDASGRAYWLAGRRYRASGMTLAMGAARCASMRTRVARR